MLAAPIQFTDEDFRADQDALHWEDRHEESKLKQADVEWKRASVFGNTKTLFGKGISPDDIGKKALSDCWFLSGASAIAEYPGKLEKVFLNSDNQLNR